MGIPSRGWSRRQSLIYNLFDPNTLDSNPHSIKTNISNLKWNLHKQNGGGETCDHTATGCSKTWLDHETAAFHEPSYHVGCFLSPWVIFFGRFFRVICCKALFKNMCFFACSWFQSFDQWKWKNPGCSGYIGDYIIQLIQLYRDYNNPFEAY